MNKEAWDKVERSMNSPFGLVDLACDDYLITVSTGLAGRKLQTIIYVDGVWKGAWILNDCEERRRFLRPVKHLVWKPKVLKGASKKTLKSLNIDPKETRLSYSPVWTSFRSLKAHLIANNASIELAPEK